MRIYFKRILLSLPPSPSFFTFCFTFSSHFLFSLFLSWSSLQRLLSILQHRLPLLNMWIRIKFFVSKCYLLFFANNLHYCYHLSYFFILCHEWSSTHLYLIHHFLFSLLFLISFHFHLYYLFFCSWPIRIHQFQIKLNFILLLLIACQIVWNVLLLFQLSSSLVKLYKPL